MNSWKNVLYKGLPILLVVVVIVVIAAIASRPKFVPKVKDSKDVVIDFRDLEVTKGELYEAMKKPMGLQVLLSEIDKELLADITLSSELVDEIEQQIADDKEQMGEEEFYEEFKKIGIMQEEGETQADLDQKIFDEYKLEYLKEQKAILRAKAAIGEDEINKMKEDYREDICVIPLKFSKIADAAEAINELAQISSENLEQEFADRWTGTTNTTDEEDQTYLEQQLTCDYERAVYKNTHITEYRDLIFNEITVGDFNRTPEFINDQFYVVYKVAVANSKSTYDQEKFEDELLKNKIDATVDQTYIKTTMNLLRSDNGLEIFDPVLAEQYKNNVDTSFKGLSKSKNKEAIAEYNGKVITAEDLYNKMKIAYGTSSILRKINLEALQSVDKIKLTKEDKDRYNEQVESIRQRFLSQGYAQLYTFEEYIMALYKVGSVEELKDLFALQDLSTRYILGYEVDGAEIYEGVDPVLDSEILEKYDEWYNIRASHILFKFDKDDEDAKAIAYTKAMQVIRGVEEDETAYIQYNNENFEGLNYTDASQYATVFGKLAATYSDDPGSKAKNGDVDFFGPESGFAEEFVEAAKATEKGLYTTEPVLTDFGYHVIYVTDVEEKPEKPENYDEYTNEQIANLIKTGERKDDEFQAVKEYYLFLQDLKSDLETEHMNAENSNMLLASLREELGFEFKDAAIQKQYAIITQMQLDYDPNEEEDEETNQ